MAGAYSHSIGERESPQYAYGLAILGGGLAFVAPQLRAPVPTWLACAIVAMLFANIWPYKALQWGAWVCLPVFLLICFDAVSTKNFGSVLFYEGELFIKSVFAASVGAFLSAKLSVRKLTSRSAAHKQRVRRRRLRSVENGSAASSARRELTAPLKSIETRLPSIPNAVASERAIEQGVHLQTLNLALASAAEEGDLSGIEWLIAEGADVNALSVDEWTLPAIPNEGFETLTVKTLFGQNVSAAVNVNQDWTPLMIATIAGHLEVVRALIAHGAEVNVTDSQGWTPLRFAVSMDETEILRTLIAAGADVNLSDHLGTTALMQAAQENIRESCKLLLDAGADTHVRDCNNQTALMIAERQNHTEIVRLLKEAEASQPSEAAGIGFRK